jgi:DNA-binding CsgD family transcriptional regulator
MGPTQGPAGTPTGVLCPIQSQFRFESDSIALPIRVFGGKQPIVLMQGNATIGRELFGMSNPSEPPTDSNLHARVERLSDGQLACLLLVDQHLSSKEIAVELGISSHTVDQRIRGALHVLGVERRSQAARMVAQVHGPYQRLIHQSPHIEGGKSSGHPGGAVGFQIRHADRAGGASDLGFETEQRPGPTWSSLPLPFATRRHPRNEMSVGLRLVWIVLIAMGATFSAGMYLAGLESLARMLGR